MELKVYMLIVGDIGEDGDGKEGSEIPGRGEDNGGYLASCMQIT